MTSMKDALRRLQYIDNQCNPKSDDPSQMNKGQDEFTRLKKEIALCVKETRKLIAERDDHIARDKGTKRGIGSGTEGAELSFRIRSGLKSIKELVVKLDAIVKKADRKLKGKNKPDLQEIIDSRKEIVKLCYQHLEECENLDKARFNDQLSQERVSLFTGNEPTGFSSATAQPRTMGAMGDPSRSALLGAAGRAGAAGAVSGAAIGGMGGAGLTELPDIEVAEDLALIRQRNVDIEQELDEIAAGVSVIKQIAIQMGDEVDRQNELLDDVERKVDKAQEHAERVNDKMKKAIDGIMKGDKFLVNCILICILLALISYIASLIV